jgi:hypothetical protein
VTNFFGHGPREMRQGLWAAMAKVVAPGGRLVIVGHSPGDVTAGVQRPPEDMMFDTQELTDFFAPLGEVLTAEEWNRQQTGSAGSTCHGGRCRGHRSVLGKHTHAGKRCSHE